MKIFLSDVTGCYHSFSDDNKTINFILNNASLEIFCEIFSDIEAKLMVEINDFTYNHGYNQRFKTKVTDKTCFRQNNDREQNILPRQDTNYTCRRLVKIESVFFNNKDNIDNIIYYPQVFLEECRYILMTNRRLLIDNIESSDTEPDSQSDSEEEFNENTL